MRFRNEEERLVAEQALLNYRELRQVMKEAPHGKGLAVLEQAVREKERTTAAYGPTSGRKELRECLQHQLRAPKARGFEVLELSGARMLARTPDAGFGAYSRRPGFFWRAKEPRSSVYLRTRREARADPLRCSAKRMRR